MVINKEVNKVNYTMKFVLFIAVMYSGLNLSADLQDALNDYQKKNYKSAYEQFMQLANVTNADAFYNIGVMFYKGQHVEKDITQAYAWMKLANQVDDYFTIKVTEEELGPVELLKSNQIFSLLNSQYGPKYFESKFNPLFDQNEELVLDALSPKPLVKFAPIFPERAV